MYVSLDDREQKTQSLLPLKIPVVYFSLYLMIFIPILVQDCHEINQNVLYELSNTSFYK